MKFVDVPIRIRHDISGGEPKQISRLIDDLLPFIQFCREDGRQELQALLSKIAITLKDGLAGGRVSREIEEDEEKLAGEISRLNLEGIEPGFLAQRVTVFACLKPQGPQTSLAMALENPFIQRALVLFSEKERSTGSGLQSGISRQGSIGH